MATWLSDFLPLHTLGNGVMFPAAHFPVGPERKAYAVHVICTVPPVAMVKVSYALPVCKPPSHHQSFPPAQLKGGPK